MLTQIQCLNEIETSIPESPRRFHVENELMGINQAKVILARTFTGILMIPMAGQELETRMEQILMDIWLEGGIKVTTMFNNELKELLFREIAGEMAEPMGDIN